MRRGLRQRPPRAPIRRSAWIAATVLGVAVTLVAAARLGGGPTDAARTPGAGEADTLRAASLQAPARSDPAALTYEPVTVVRDVTGTRITAGPRPEGPLIRLPSAVEVPEPPPPEPARDRFRLVIVRHADEIDARDRIIALRHVDAPSAATVCVNAAGKSWPCGMRARTAVRRLIRRRIIACEPVGLGGDAPPERVTTACSVAHVDIGRWLVENGWARPAADAPEELVALYAEARDKGLGLWQPDAR